MLRTVVALVLAVHGLIHLIGFVVPWRITEVEGFTYTTTAVWGRIELGDAGARVLGVLWLPAAVAFVVAAYGIWQCAAWAVPLTAVTAVVSLALSVLGAPAAVAGIAINVVILAMIAYFQLVAPAGQPTP